MSETPEAPAAKRPADAPTLPAVRDDDGRPAFLTRSAPLIDSLPDRWVSYIAQNVAQQDERAPITKGELGLFVELCAAYELDPFAKEAWIAKSKTGKLLVMVGRDGLRKIAQRNGLHVDGDVVREKDSLQIVRTPDGNRTVAHSYGNPAERGAIVGAWAEVREGGPTGRPMGYFYAPLDEYRPADASSYSPWSKQVGVMILAAAERQAIRQATPLGGLYSEGEFESMTADRTSLTDGEGAGMDPAAEILPDVLAVTERAERLGHRGLASRETAAMVSGNPSAEGRAAWISNAMAELDAMDAEPVADAEVVDEANTGAVAPEDVQTPDPAPEADGDREAAQDAPQAGDPDEWSLADRIESCRADLRAADDAGDRETFESLSHELEALIAEQDAQENPDQTDLGL